MMRTGLVVASVLFLLNAAAQGQERSWANPGDGVWHDANSWDPLGLPSSDEAIFITNDFTKTVTIDSTTSDSFPGTMTVSNLTLSAPAGSTNTLILDNAGTNTPLTLQGHLTVESGGVISLVDSSLQVQGTSFDAALPRHLINGVLSAQNNSVVTVHDNLWVGQNAGSTGTLNLVESELTVSNETRSANLFIGFFGELGPAVGTMMISNSTVDVDNVLDVGVRGGEGTLTIAESTVLATILQIGLNANTISPGTVWVKGGQLLLTNVGAFASLSGQLNVGEGSKLVVTNGTVMASNVVVGVNFNHNSMMIITGPGSVLTNTGELIVGRGFTNNTMIVSGGARVDSGSGIIGLNFDTNEVFAANNRVIVTGTNSQWNVGALSISPFDSHTSDNQLIVSNGATVRVAGEFSVGSDSNLTGLAVIIRDGGTLILGNTAIFGNADGAQALLDIESGSVTVSSNFVAGNFMNSTGVVMVIGGELTITNAELVIGTNGGVGEVMLMPPGSGSLQPARRPYRRLTVSGGGGSVLRARRIKIATGSTGTLTVDDGSASVLEDVLVGAVPTATGAVVVGTSLTVGGDLELRYNPKLECHICGYEEGKTFGHIAVGGTATFAGDFAVRFLNGFENQITNGSSFTVLTAGTVAGMFTNVTSGQRLVTADGAGDFLVTYSTNNLVLSDFKNTFSRPSAGTFTMLLPHNPADGGSSFPQGDGYAVLKIDEAGKITGKGALADNTKLKLAGVVSVEGRWLVSAAGGSLTGTVSFTSDSLTGDLTRTKLPNPKSKFYPDGFTTRLLPVGSRYTTPPVSQPGLDVMFQDGNLFAPLDVMVTLDTNFKATAPIKLAVKSKTGQFTGKFMHPVTGKATKFSGVVLQQQNFGGGFFLGTNESGSVTLEPVP